MGLTGTVLESLTKAVTQDTSYVATAQVWVSLHSANPGSTGLHEVTSGVGAAGRQHATFTGADGTDANVASLSFTLTAETVTWLGYWTAQTGGSFLGGFPMVGTGTVLAATTGIGNLVCPLHGRSVNDPVRLFALVGNVASGIPAGFSADTVYYVKSVPSASVLTLSATRGGSIIVPSSSAACGVYLDQSVTDGTGVLTFPASSGLHYVTTS